MMSLMNVLAQASTPDRPAVTAIIAVVLILSVAVASLMSSKRGHRD